MKRIQLSLYFILKILSTFITYSKLSPLGSWDYKYMEDYRCFEPSCMLNAVYECPCSSLPVYTCKLHVLDHMEVPNKDHAMKPIFLEPCEKTKEAILLGKGDSIEDFNHKSKEEIKLRINLRNVRIEEDLKEKSEFFENSKSSKWERELKDPCLADKSNSNANKKSVTQVYQDIVNTYQQSPFLFNIVKEHERTNLLIYDTEIESQASIILDTPQPISQGTCIAQLPNGKLFCFGNVPYSGITLLIDENFRVEELPSGIVCAGSSAIYFNNSVYCFGGTNMNLLALSSRFDLDRNQWNELIPMPKADWLCNSVIFNGSILISGWFNKNLWRYSIDSNSFSTIHYDFTKDKRKILINEDRLHLIECGVGWSIYESEIGSDTAWRKIANNSEINFYPYQVYCQYNKEEIYIGFIDWANNFCCIKFCLNEKRLINLV